MLCQVLWPGSVGLMGVSREVRREFAWAPLISPLAVGLTVRLLVYAIKGGHERAS